MSETTSGAGGCGGSTRSSCSCWHWVGWYKFDWDREPRQVALIWLGVMFLLLVFVVLALIDVRLTWKLQRSLRERKRQ